MTHKEVELGITDENELDTKTTEGKAIKEKALMTILVKWFKKSTTRRRFILGQRSSRARIAVPNQYLERELYPVWMCRAMRLARSLAMHSRGSPALYYFTVFVRKYVFIFRTRG